MRDIIKKILKEETEKEWEYHLRYIDGIVAYKRKVGDEKWSFCDPEDFVNEAHELNIVKWEKEK